MIFGSPAAYFLELAIGYPAYTLLKANQRLPIERVAAAGAVGGASAFSTPLVVLFGQWSVATLLWFAMIGALGGAFAGATFWLIAFAGRALRRAA